MEHHCLCNITLEYHCTLWKCPEVAEPNIARFCYTWNQYGTSYTRRFLQWPQARGTYSWLKRENQARVSGENMEKDWTKRGFKMWKHSSTVVRLTQSYLCTANRDQLKVRTAPIKKKKKRLLTFFSEGKNQSSQCFYSHDFQSA